MIFIGSISRKLDSPRPSFLKIKGFLTWTSMMLNYVVWYLSNYFYLCRTFNELILIWTMIGAKWVLIIWFGWLIVSASITTNCNPRANSKILSTSFCTSTKNIVRWCQNIRFTVYTNLQRFFFKPSFCSLSALSACLASERSAGIRNQKQLFASCRWLKL